MVCYGIVVVALPALLECVCWSCVRELNRRITSDLKGPLMAFHLGGPNTIFCLLLFRAQLATTTFLFPSESTCVMYIQYTLLYTPSLGVRSFCQRFSLCMTCFGGIFTTWTF